jgi:hypothetical protein
MDSVKKSYSIIGAIVDMGGAQKKENKAASTKNKIIGHKEK